MNRKWLLLLFLCSALCANAEPDRKLYQKIWPSIVRVHAVMDQGKTATGSGIVVAPDKVISNCHVTRDARAIDIVAWNSKWKVKEQVKDVDHDLCLLIVTREIGKPVEFGDSVAIGKEVLAAGHPNGGRLEVTDGQITGLHNLDGGQIIQSTAAFDSGESGGGVFDRDGKLIGVITFRSQAGGAFYFAVPVAWVQKLMLAQPSEFEGAKKTLAFWERVPDHQPPFMRAIAREAVEDWNGLMFFASQWAKDEATNAESWIALGKALFHLRHHVEAIDALKKAIEIDPSHSRAWLYLARAYRDSGDKNSRSIAEEKLLRLDAIAAKAFSTEAGR